MNLRSGEIVEMAGEVMGNPLRQFLDMISAFAPYVGINIDGSNGQDERTNRADRRRAARKRPQTPTASGEDLGPQEIELFRTLRNDVDRSYVVDLLLRSDGGVRAILTAAREFLSDQAEDYLLGGEFRVIGKATRVIREDGHINLLRRTALGMAGRELARELFDGVGIKDIDVELAEPVIEPPAVQLLPLGIYT